MASQTESQMTTSPHLRTDRLEVIDLSRVDRIYIDREHPHIERKLYFLGGPKKLTEIRFEDDELAKRLLAEQGFKHPEAPFNGLQYGRVVYALKVDEEEEESWEDRMRREAEQAQEWRQRQVRRQLRREEYRDHVFNYAGQGHRCGQGCPSCRQGH